MVCTLGQRYAVRALSFVCASYSAGVGYLRWECIQSSAGVVAHAPREDFPPTDQMNEEIVLSNWLGVPLAPEQELLHCESGGAEVVVKRKASENSEALVSGAPGETRTHTGRVLNPLPLPIGLLGRRQESI